jgi:pyruvate formate lyase activating enzyme
VDLVYYDVKIADPAAHRRYTGVGNERILDNLARLLRQRRVRVRPRIPLVPGITATRENLSAVVDFLCRAGADSVSLLPYNPLGMPMFARLGKHAPSLPQRFMNEAEEAAVLADFTAILREKNAAAAQFAERS